MFTEKPADTKLNRIMANGHYVRFGHIQDDVLISEDGSFWTRVNLCCGETVPNAAPEIVPEPVFQEDDVVRFADGNGKMFLWGDVVTIDTMFVQSSSLVDGVEMVETSAHPYTFTLEASKLVKVGSAYDTHYNEAGDEVHTWLPELDEED